MKIFAKISILFQIITIQLFFGVNIYAQSNPTDLSKVKYVKYIEEKISKSDSANNVFFFPENTNWESRSNLANVIVDAVLSGKIKVYETSPKFIGSKHELFLDIEIVKNYLGQQSDTAVGYDYETDKDTMYVIETPLNTNEISHFILHDLLFYDISDKLIYKQIVGITPVREWNYEYDDYMRRKVFYIKFDDIASLLNTGRGISYLDLILTGKYNAEVTDDFGKGLFQQYYQDTIFQKCVYVNISENPFELKNLIPSKKKPETIIKAKQFETAQIVYVKLTKDSENIQLFSNNEIEMGYKSLIDWCLDKILIENYPVYDSANFRNKIDSSEIKKLLGNRIDSLIVYVEHYDGDFLISDTLIVVKTNYNSQEITSYIFKEIWTFDKKGNTISKQIIGICPVREYINYQSEENELIYKEVFWLKYSDYSELFKNKYITKISPSADQTYHEFFQKNRYNFEIIEKKDISKDEALKITESLK